MTKDMLTKADIITAASMPLLVALSGAGSWLIGNLLLRLLDPGGGNFMLLFIIMPVDLFCIVAIAVALAVGLQALLGQRHNLPTLKKSLPLFAVLLAASLILVAISVPFVWHLMNEHGYAGALGKKIIIAFAVILYFIMTSSSYLLAKKIASRVA